MWGLRFRSNLEFLVQIKFRLQGFDPNEGLGLLSNLGVRAAMRIWAIRANQFARAIRNSNPYLPDSRESLEFPIRDSHAIFARNSHIHSQIRLSFASGMSRFLF